jgi:Flp pilus assembly protein TadG
MNRLRREKGAALVETAITIPILLLISVAIFEFGRAYQTWEVVTNAAREGARSAVIAGNTDDVVRDQVNLYLRNGGVLKAGETIASVGGSIPINRAVALTGAATASQVEVDLPFQFIVLNPVVRLVTPGSTTGAAPITMVATATMRNEG